MVPENEGKRGPVSKWGGRQGLVFCQVYMLTSIDMSSIYPSRDADATFAPHVAVTPSSPWYSEGMVTSTFMMGSRT